MKLLFGVILYIFLISPADAQRTNSRLFGAETSIAVNYPGEAGIQIRGLITKGCHMVLSGFYVPVTRASTDLYGLDLIYRYFPNKSQAQVDVFFQYSLLYRRRKLFSESAQKGSAVHNRIGYGLIVSLSQEIALVHSIGAGIENSWIKGIPYMDLSLYADIGFIVFINFKK